MESPAMDSGRTCRDPSGAYGVPQTRTIDEPVSGEGGGGGAGRSGGYLYRPFEDFTVHAKESSG